MSKSLKHVAAVALYRWQLSAGIISVVFSALAFVGVFSIFFALPVYALLFVVIAVVFGTGLVLDKGLRFWEAQALVGTVRNPWLVDRMYQKELILLKTSTIPQLEAIRFVLTLMQFPLEPKFADHRGEFVLELDQHISRMKQAVADKRWTIEEGEDVYG